MNQTKDSLNCRSNHVLLGEGHALASFASGDGQNSIYSQMADPHQAFSLTFILISHAILRFMAGTKVL